ncbi:MAG: phosphate/phosphite/phosphonate ABC transporter substrate-binding protein [Burkholderiaceae bacterium]|jgi:phosphonate transport system substrate-binding protein|nr:phosphate/phosphite/phosphonate ABC transporter substrate-binding protein [Burkholderiaceae bacterium]
MPSAPAARSTPAQLRRQALGLPLLLVPALARGGLPAEALRIGLVPYLSTRAMVGVFEPLRSHLEARLARPARLFTAADFRALADNARQGAYALALLPPHLARIAVADWGHALVARSALTANLVLFARRDRPLALPDGLRGQRIATLDPLSLASLALQRWLVQQGLVTGREVGIDHVRSITSAVIAVQRGDAIAVAGSTAQLRDLSPAETADLVPVAHLATVPAVAFVAHTAVPPAEVEAWRRAVLDFVPPASTDPGLSRTRFIEAALRDFDGVESFAQEARRLLATPRTSPRRTGTP